MSLYHLLKCALTDPGIIPALIENISGIPDQMVKHPFNNMDYYYEYQSR